MRVPPGHPRYVYAPSNKASNKASNEAPAARGAAGVAAAPSQVAHAPVDEEENSADEHESAVASGEQAAPAPCGALAARPTRAPRQAALHNATQAELERALEDVHARTSLRTDRAVHLNAVVFLFFTVRNSIKCRPAATSTMVARLPRLPSSASAAWCALEPAC